MSRPVSLDTFIWDYDLYDLSDLTQRGITALTQVSENALRQWRRDKYTLKANPRSLAHLDRHLRDHLNVETVVNDPESKYDVWGSNGRYITETIDHEPDVAQDMDHTINTVSCSLLLATAGRPRAACSVQVAEVDVQSSANSYASSSQCHTPCSCLFSGRAASSNLTPRPIRRAASQYYP